MKHEPVNPLDEESGCICGCAPHEPCWLMDCPHCDIPANSNIPKRNQVEECPACDTTII